VLAEAVPYLLEEIQLFLWSEVIEINGGPLHVAIVSPGRWTARQANTQFRGEASL
jgi:hypothetical protein